MTVQDNPMSKTTARLRADVQTQIDRLAKVRADLDQTDFLQETLPALKKLVGTTHVYRKNCYSCPSKPSDYWDVFFKVLAVIAKPETSGAYLILEEVHIDSYGVPVWTVKSEWIHTKGMRTGVVPCKASEYTKAKRNVGIQLLHPSKMRSILARE